MPRVDLDLHSPIRRSPRVTQLEGMFDVPRSDKTTASYHFDVPLEDRPWQIGLITGPSGAGKSTVARHLFGEDLVDEYDWAPDIAVVDNFGDLGVRQVTQALSSVGFSSPPSWLKPYAVLSTGEKFRANLARALVDEVGLVVIDEFTSVVDRTVARIGSAAVAKSVRATEGKQLVAVSCHDDIVDWLQPDWVLELPAGDLTWRCLQPDVRRPPIDVEVVRTERAAWKWFAAHHYLSADLHKAARCFVGLVDGRPACFAGVIHYPHPSTRLLWSVSRLVVLPDFQGAGIGLKFVSAVASIIRGIGGRPVITTSHPALIWALARASDWTMTRKPSLMKGSKTARLGWCAEHRTRRTAGFRYVGDRLNDEAAGRLWG